MKLAVILVHYHTPKLLAESLAALQTDAATCGMAVEWLVVDNGSTPAEQAELTALPVRYLRPGLSCPGDNLGYAGGANFGIRHTDADALVVMNPDVFVLPGCLGALLAALATGADAAGPQFFWDRDLTFLLPPTESLHRWDEVLKVLATRSRSMAKLARRRWRRHAHRHWRAHTPILSHALSGALLAFRRDAWSAVGPWDEGYRLYFEETDWLERLRVCGRTAYLVPAAQAIHLYAQSSLSEPRAAEWFLAANRRFRRAHLGSLFTHWLEGLSRLLERIPPRSEETKAMMVTNSVAWSAVENERAAWLELSASPLGFPAAGRILRRVSEAPLPVAPLPAELWARLGRERYYLRTLAADGQELAVRALCQEPG